MVPITRLRNRKREVGVNQLVNIDVGRSGSAMEMGVASVTVSVENWRERKIK